MKKLLLLLFIVFNLSACQSTPEMKMPEIDKNSYDIDISGKEQVKERSNYWVPIVRLEPAYPRRAYRHNVIGCIDLIFSINEKGMMENYQVRESKKGDVFIKATIYALKKWKWKPSKQNSDRKSVLTSNQFRFNGHYKEIVAVSLSTHCI